MTLLGLRLGASVAAAAAARRSDVARLVLWDPVIDGAAYMQTVLRLNLMYQMAQHRKVIENREALVARLARGETVNIEGYEVAEPLFRQVSDFRLHDMLQQFAGEVLIVQINQGEAQVKPELAALAEGNLPAPCGRGARGAVLEGDQDLLPAGTRTYTGQPRRFWGLAPVSRKPHCCVPEPGGHAAARNPA